MSPDRPPRRRYIAPLAPLAALAAALACAGPALGVSSPADPPSLLTPGALSLDADRTPAQPEAAATPIVEPESEAPPLTLRGTPRKPFGRAGSEWLTFGAAAANNLGSENDFNLHAAYSQFLADELEFALEAAGWYFDQQGDDTGGVSGSMVLRWHHFHDEDFSWTMYSDVGIGLLAAFDETPRGGQEFNFLPRIGGGFTRRLNDEGARLQIGARWHHISNGRYTGDERNPSRDSVMIYAAIVIPF